MYLITVSIIRLLNMLKFIPMGLACPTCTGSRGICRSISQEISADEVQEKNFFCHGSCPLEHRMPGGDRDLPYPIGLPKGPETLRP